MKIRKATQEDISAIFQNIQDCKEDMQKNNIEQWKEGYPTLEDTEKNISNTFVMEDDNNVIASVVANETQAKEYTEIQWKLDDKKPLVLHRLAVSPKYHGQGIAQKIINYIETLAKDKGYKSVRLDTYSKNLASNKFYTKLGYIERGKFYFKHLKPEHYIAFEKIL